MCPLYEDQPATDEVSDGRRIWGQKSSREFFKVGELELARIMVRDRRRKRIDF